MSTLLGKNILVTGANGFIGRHLAARLRDLPDVGLISISRNFLTAQNSNTKWVRTPLQQLTKKTWRDHGIEKIDFIFHLGAFIPKCRQDADRVNEIYESNLIGTRALLESLPNIPRKILFASTVDVYSALNEEFITERSSLSPNGLYGASKIFCEKLIETFALTQGCESAILRYGHIYGPGEDAYAKLIPQTIRALLTGEPPKIYGAGTALRDFLYVDDAVEATLRAAISVLPGREPINIVSGQPVSIREIVELLCHLTGTRDRIQFLHELSDGLSLRFNNEKMLRTLGSWDLVPLAIGLKQEIDYFRGRQ